MSTKEGKHSPLHTKLRDVHTSLILVVFLNSLPASLLTSWHLSTTASVTIELPPTPVAEGDNVLFLVRNLPEDVIDVTWFKGLRNKKQQIAVYVLHKNLSMPGPIHSGREIIYHNGSLLLEKVTQKDAGFYTLRTYDRGRKFISTMPIYLHVHGK